MKSLNGFQRARDEGRRVGRIPNDLTESGINNGEHVRLTHCLSLYRNCIRFYFYSNCLLLYFFVFFLCAWTLLVYNFSFLFFDAYFDYCDVYESQLYTIFFLYNVYEL